MKWWLYIGLLLACNAVAWQRVVALHARGNEPPALYFFDVGQGDSELIELHDVQILIDGGPPNGKVLAGLERVLGPEDRYIDLVILTHPHLDHFGGLIDIMKRYRVGKFMDGGGHGTAPALRDLPARDIMLGEGDVIRYKNYALKILAPNISEREDKDPNKTSVAALFEMPQANVLYLGDAHGDNEERIRKEYKLGADVVKIGHHGSRFSSGEKFLREVKPKIAVIEVGKNSYGHPHASVLEKLEEAGALVYTTLQNGMIKIVPQGNSLKILTEKAHK